MSRTKVFAYNSISTAAFQIVTMLAGFVLPKVMLTVYGSEINGLLSSITQFISYFNLVEAGISGAAVYALYKPLSEKNHSEINGTLVAAKNFYNQAGFIFVILTLLLAGTYPFYIKSQVLGSMEIGILVLILGVNGALEFFTMSKYRVLLTADQKTYVLSIIFIIYVVFNTALVVALAYLGMNIVLLKFIAILPIFFRSFMLWIYCKKKYPYIDYSQPPNHAALNKRWDAFYLQILGAVQMGLPVVLLTIISKDLKQVSVYTIFNMVIGGIGGILGIFTSGLSASFGEIIAKNEKQTLKQAYKEFEFIYYLLITIVYSITFITIGSFVNVYTKGIFDVNYNLPLTGFLFVLNGLLYNVKTPQGMLVISAGMYKETRWQTTTQTIIAVVFELLFGFFWVINGILLGSILSNLYRDIDLMIFVPKNITKTRVLDTLKKISRMIACVLVSYVPFLFLNISPDNFVSWILYATVVSLYVTVVSFIINIAFDRNEMSNVILRIKGMVIKK